MTPRVYAMMALMLSQQVALSPDDVVQFLGGLVFGLIQKDDLSKIQTCINDCQDLQKDITTAVEDFEKKDMADILAGIEEVGKVIQEFPADLGDCQGMQADVTRIENWAKIFNDPSKLVQTILVNVVQHLGDIIGDITKMSGDIGSNNWYNAGDDIADVLVKSLGPVPEDPETLTVTMW